MSIPSSVDSAKPVAQEIRLRPAHVVMDLERLGSLHQSRLSFMRSLVRKIMREGWQIEARRFELDAEGYGTVVYRVQTSGDLFSFVLFSQYLDPDKRNDRVIASEWDLTMALCEGEVDDAYVEYLRLNVPLQEAGRLDSRVMVLSRANRSVRNFDSVVAALSAGQQPEVEQIAKVGYLYRTTAVYGSGKLGMADWEKVSSKHPDFARPFAAEMFNCFMLRNFSLQQAEHIARQRAPDTAVPMQPTLKRYFGIGNSTGLGMAPYLINHPQLISRWIEMRELALARVRGLGQVTAERLARMQALVEEASGRLTLIHGRFGEIDRLLAERGIDAVDGITFDIGVSSMQLDQGERGFAFMHDGPLDMRMSQDGESAADFLNTAEEEAIANVLYHYGEERQSRRVARAIVAARPLATTGELARVVRRALGYKPHDKKDPATRTFQAVRIHVNDELAELEAGLAAAEALLKDGGVLAVVSFHSLEDRIVKHFLRAGSGAGRAISRHLPGEIAGPAPSFTQVSKGIRPTEAEIARNPRARSSTLRHAIRTGAPARSMAA